MRLFCLGLVLTALVASPATGLAEVEGVYLAINSGPASRGNADVTLDGVPAGTSNFSTGFHFGTAVGIQLDNHFRFETEITYRENKVDLASDLDGKVMSTAFLVNVYYDFERLGPVRPFVGAGAGLGVVHFKSVLGLGFDDDNTALAYQGTAGIQWDFRPQWTLSMAYRYLATTDPKIITPLGKLETEFGNHELVLGLRFLFNL